MNIFVPSAKLVVLKELPFSDYAFPRWQSNAAILLLGILSGVLQVMMPVRPCFHRGMSSGRASSSCGLAIWWWCVPCAGG